MPRGFKNDSLPLCGKCRQRACEIIDEWISPLCEYCADKDYEAYQERKEWEHFHSD